MAEPVIFPTTSFNIYRRGEYFQAYLSATNTPTSWTCVGTDADGMAVTLAALGLAFDTAKGILSGAFKHVGFFDFVFVAHNADGYSAPLPVPVGIEDVGFAVDATIGIEVDVETGFVTRTLAAAAVAGAPVLYGKHGGQMLLTVLFKKQGAALTMNLTSLMLGLKEFEPEPLIDLTDGTFYALGGGFRVLLDLNAVKVKTALGNYEADAATIFDAIGEVRWEHYEQVSDGDPAVALISRSRNFIFQLERGLIPNP